MIKKDFDIFKPTLLFTGQNMLKVDNIDTRI